MAKCYRPRRCTSQKGHLNDAFLRKKVTVKNFKYLSCFLLVSINELFTPEWKMKLNLIFFMILKGNFNINPHLWDNATLMALYQTIATSHCPDTH